MIEETTTATDILSKIINDTLQDNSTPLPPQFVNPGLEVCDHQKFYSDFQGLNLIENLFFRILKRNQKSKYESEKIRVMEKRK